MNKYKYDYSKRSKQYVDKENSPILTSDGEPIIIVTETVNRTVSDVYPDLGVLARGIDNNLNSDTIKKNYLKALHGVNDAPFLSVENDWFYKFNEVKALKDEFNTLSYTDVDTITQEDKEARLKELSGYKYRTLNDNGVFVDVIVNGLIKDAMSELEDLENGKTKGFSNNWLKNYRIQSNDVNSVNKDRPDTSANIVIPDDVVKQIIAHDRNKMVRNSEDSIADIAKMTSLLFSTVAAMYRVTPEIEKNKIPEQERAIIEYAVAKFASVNTRADDQLAVEGTKLIDKLFDREVKIGTIIKNHKN